MSLKENDNFYEHQHENKKEKALSKVKGGMVGALKRTIKNKSLKKDHYQAFKKQHKIK